MKPNLVIPALAALVVAAGPALAQSGDGNSSASAPSGGNRSSTAWSPSAMERASLAPRPNVNPADVRAASKNRAAPPSNPGQTPAADLGDAGGPKERSAGNVLSKPLYWAGKLFFRAPDGDYVCSGQFISPNVVLTAAHCVRDSDTGAWYQDLIFALQYNSGQYGAVYSYDCVATRNSWVQPGFEKFLSDYAMIRVDKPSRTGNFGTHWGWRGAYNEANKIGYPGGVADGEVIQVEHGPIAFVDGVVQLTHGNTADQGGSSGGAWIGQYSDAEGNNDGNYIISVESFGYDEEPGIDYGPYLDENFKSLWDYVENGCK
ncbi:MAG: trypsin-like serine protease [Bauldia sp.]|nr:trypsin-like serine protease [Bauldia sp.]